MSKQSIPNYILQKIRQRLGFDKNDTAMDESIKATPAMQRLRDVVGWELGDPAWADQLVTWAKDCGMEIVDPRA